MAKHEPSEIPIYYWDANAFLAGISNEPGRAPIIAAVLEDASRGLCEVYTSVLSIAEVAFGAAEKQGGALDATVEASIDGLWHPSSPVKLVDLDPMLARDARLLIRRAIASGRSGLKAADAIHLASAARVDASELHTYDRLARYQDLVSFHIREPHTHETPLWPEGLPARPLPTTPPPPTPPAPAK